MGAAWDYYFTLPITKLDEPLKKTLEAWFYTYSADQDHIISLKGIGLSFWHAEDNEIAPILEMNVRDKVRNTLDRLNALKKDLNLESVPLLNVGMEGELDTRVVAVVGVLYPIDPKVTQQTILQSIENLSLSMESLSGSSLKGEKCGLEFDLISLIHIDYIGLYWGRVDPLYEEMKIQEGSYLGTFYVAGVGTPVEDFLRKLNEIWKVLEQTIRVLGELWSKKKAQPVRWISTLSNPMVPYHGPLQSKIQQIAPDENQGEVEKESSLFENDAIIIKEISQTLNITLQRQTTPLHKNWNYGYLVKGNRVIGLGLTHCGLTEFPTVIQHLNALEILDLSWNEITAVPSWIGQLAALKTLFIVKNRLQNLPEEFHLLKNLESLWLQLNQLKTIPPSIFRLRSIKMLILSNNVISSIPSTIEDLVSLETLELWKNQIHKIPPNLGKLRNLRVLRLSDNPIRTLPDAFENLTSLEELDLFGCSIKRDPVWIPKLPKLKKFRK